MRQENKQLKAVAAELPFRRLVQKAIRFSVEVTRLKP
jgi:hypothetical protein